MKLKYQFDTVNMGEEIISVPVGKGSEQVHGIVKLNTSGYEVMGLLKDEMTSDDIIDILASKYENNKDELSKYVNSVIGTLGNAGLIE